MSDVLPQRTKEQILKNRLQALERLERNKALRKQNQNTENRLKLPAEPSQVVQSTKTILTEAQKAAIEAKRMAAIEKATSNNLISQQDAEALKAKKISPGKATAPSKLLITQNRPNPYLKPQNPVQNVVVQQKSMTSYQVNSPGKSLAPSKASITSNRSNPYQKPTKKPVVHVLCTLELISNDRFFAKTDNYSEAVINEFKKLKTKSYSKFKLLHFHKKTILNYRFILDQTNRTWSFNMSEYQQLLTNLGTLKEFVDVVRVPDFVINLMKKPEPTVDESCLEAIEPKLLNSLLKFQREAVCYGIARNGRFLLADDMGLGKTRQALAIADFYREDWPLLIITTASTRSWWQKQILELLPNVNVLAVHVMESSKDSIMGAKVLICSYSSLENNLTRLSLMDFGMIILDESHNIKNPKSKQTINATKLCKTAKHVVMISGTPALSRPVELFQQLEIINPKFATYFTFTQRYCQGHQAQFGWIADGSSNLDELNLLLRKTFMIRRTKEEVYAELGGKNRQMVELKDMQLKKSEVEGMQEFSEGYQKAEGKKQQQNEILLQWYSETAKLKADAVSHYVQDFLKTSDEKCLIFAYHHCMMDAITECLQKNKIRNVRIDGSSKAENRTYCVENFQNDPLIRCAVLSIKACSAGITLTAASTVIFAELDWTPSNMIQAEARAHRIGQERQVTCIYLIAPGTADDLMWKMLQEKQRNLTKAGLVTTGEHLSQNMTKSTFDAGPSTSKQAANTSRITDFFVKSPNTSSTSSESFYTCENVQNDSDDIINNLDFQAIEAEAKSKENILSDDFLDGVDFQAIEAEAESKYKENSLDDDCLDGIDFQAIEDEAKKKGISPVDELLNGIDFDQEDEFMI
jgi:SWI/SNF-related matrix-associated actin-dependent regulator of chromatin subfamily A-like protein 1